ncbi:hypothetical protein SteCoe_5568 [Stentor coeruleus]|uniref:GPI inositol-deacylase n=1 Tax=Stentor coeruleus TaxID=5963 RepID=A0A1R2CS16_9CILI|nr:hypothetical protein SteCoe_5568 [Stentor coeruleus]
MSIGPNYNTQACIFIHGHRGDYSQAKLFSSVMGDICDMYSFDFKEDISGLSHEVIIKQAEFVTESIVEIQKKFITVYVLAHSMGGIVALLSAKKLTKDIDTIIILNGPLQQSPVNSYLGFPIIYEEVHKYLLETHSKIISITGGSDITIPASLTNPYEIYKKHYYTSALPRVYEQLEHNDILYNIGLILTIKDLMYLEVKELGSIFAWENMDDLVSEYKENEIFTETELFDGSNNIEFPCWCSFFLVYDAYVFIRTSTAVDEFKSPEPIQVEQIETEFFYIYKILSIPGEKVWFWAPEGEIYIETIDDDYEITPKSIFLSPMTQKSHSIFHIRAVDFYRIPIEITFSHNPDIIYAKCAHEEIIIRNKKNAHINFHEYCENGIDIWVINPQGQVKVFFNLYDYILVLFREFRVLIIGLAFGIFLDFRPYIVCGVLVFYMFGDFFRYYGMLGLDHVDYIEIRLSLLEIMIIMIMGFGVGIFIDLVYRGIQKLGKIKFWESCGVKIYWLGLVFVAPWIVLEIFLVLGLRKCRNLDFKMLFVSFLITLPQQVAWYWRVYNYFYLSLANVHDIYAVFAMAIYIWADVKISENYRKIAAWYFLICGQDLLYRGNLVLSTFLAVVGVIKYIKYIKLDKVN